MPDITHLLEKDAKSESILPEKVFAHPFRLVFMNNDGETTWIEVASLEGLKAVCARIERDEIRPLNRATTLELQLWGLLAEHCGFLRFGNPTSFFGMGIQPEGAGAAALAGDLTNLFGSSEEALAEMNAMQKRVRPAVTGVSPTPTERAKSPNPGLLATNGALTEKGVGTLNAILQDTGFHLPSSATQKLDQQTKLAEKLVEQTQPDQDVPAPASPDQIGKSMDEARGNWTTDIDTHDGPPIT